MAMQPTLRWIDLSGAPPVLLPATLAPQWRGVIDPKTNKPRELDLQNPVTDYDRACAAAWPGKNTIDFKGSVALAFYTEFDDLNWDARRLLVALGGWLPSDEELQETLWTDAVIWEADHADYLLFNAGLDASAGLHDDDVIQVRLKPGTYTVSCGQIDSEYAGNFHRLVRGYR